MPLLRLSLMMGAAALCLLGCAKFANVTPAASSKDYSSLSGQLKKDMSEQEAAATLGSAPDKADLVTCTDSSGAPWQCRTWLYYGGRPKNSVRLVFYQADDKAWRVATWQIY
jgi:hypothetical protein